jgi:hypothetical protein
MPLVGVSAFIDLGGLVQIIDNKYRLFGVINLIDLVVVIAVLAGAFAVYRVLSPSAPTAVTKDTKAITYQVFCPSLRNFSADQIKIGDSIAKTTGKSIGKVTAVRVVPSPGETLDYLTKKAVPYESTYVSDVYITVVAQGQPSPTGVTVGDLQIHSNQPMPVMTSTFQCDTANITDLKIAGE